MEIGNFDPEEILKFQMRQHSNPKKREVTKRREKLRNRDIGFIKKFFPEAKSVLCVGARDDSEVQGFINNGFDAIGIDIANETKLIKKCDACDLDIFFKNRNFDLIYASHVLEHTINSKKVMQNIRNISRHGVIILLPLNSKDPREKHPTIFEIMQIKSEDNHIFTKPSEFKNIWNDFDNFKPFEISFGEFRKGINEREVMMVLKFLN